MVGISTARLAGGGGPLAASALVFEVFGRLFGPPAILACGLTCLGTIKFKVYEARAAEGTRASLAPSVSSEASPPSGGVADVASVDPSVEPAIASPPAEPTDDEPTT